MLLPYNVIFKYGAAAACSQSLADYNVMDLKLQMENER